MSGSVHAEVNNKGMPDMRAVHVDLCETGKVLKDRIVLIFINETWMAYF